MRKHAEKKPALGVRRFASVFGVSERVAVYVNGEIVAGERGSVSRVFAGERPQSVNSERLAPPVGRIRAARRPLPYGDVVYGILGQFAPEYAAAGGHGVRRKVKVHIRVSPVSRGWGDVVRVMRKHAEKKAALGVRRAASVFGVSERIAVYVNPEVLADDGGSVSRVFAGERPPPLDVFPPRLPHAEAALALYPLPGYDALYRVVRNGDMEQAAAARRPPVRRKVEVHALVSHIPVLFVNVRQVLREDA